MGELTALSNRPYSCVIWHGAILAWDSTYTSSLQKVQVKQNHVAQLIFFTNIRGKDTGSALPLLNLLDMLTIYNIYSLHVLKFAHLWHKGLSPDVFRNTFQYASEVHSYNTRYATQKNFGPCVFCAPLDRYIGRHIDRHIGRYVGQHID